jgi:hypothetical protein
VIANSPIIIVIQYFAFMQDHIETIVKIS